MTTEKVNKIIQDYLNPEIKVVDICKKYSLNGVTMKKILTENNIPNRCPNKVGSRAKSKAVKKCSNCHRKIDVKGARFCPFCGEDIRSEKDILIEEVNRLFTICAYLPYNQRDEAQNTITKMRDFLNRKDL